MKLQDGQYLIGGQPVLNLAEEFGTPLYVYDGDKIVSQYKKLVKAFDGINFKVKYVVLHYNFNGLHDSPKEYQQQWEDLSLDSLYHDGLYFNIPYFCFFPFYGFT